MVWKSPKAYFQGYSAGLQGVFRSRQATCSMVEQTAADLFGVGHVRRESLFVPDALGLLTGSTGRSSSRVPGPRYQEA